jgi:hypothetical protein
LAIQIFYSVYAQNTAKEKGEIAATAEIRE